MAGVNIELEVDEIGERVGQAWGGQVVADLATLAGGTHQPAPPQARQMIRDVRPPDPEPRRELGRVDRPVEQCEQDAPPSGVRQRGADPLQRV